MSLAIALCAVAFALIFPELIPGTSRTNPRRYQEAPRDDERIALCGHGGVPVLPARAPKLKPKVLQECADLIRVLTGVACWLAPRGLVVDLAACRDTILGERQCS
jgi:hypothetical protein